MRHTQWFPQKEREEEKLFLSFVLAFSFLRFGPFSWLLLFGFLFSILFWRAEETGEEEEVEEKEEGEEEEEEIGNSKQSSPSRKYHLLKK